MNDCRIHEWDEARLFEEWQGSIEPEHRFRGWTRLNAVGQKIEDFRRRCPDGEHPNRKRQVGRYVRRAA